MSAMSRTRIALAATVAAFLASPIGASVAQADPSEMAGFYAGAHVGYTDANADFGSTLDEQNLLGGLQAGYNFLSGNIIWGIETDVSLTGADPDGACPFNAGLSCDVDVQGLATLRARAGYASGNWLFYVTGGAAAGQFDIDTVGAAGSSHDDDGDIGWTVGAGVEYLVGGGKPGPRNVGVKLEYRYLSLDGWTELDIDAEPGTGIRREMDFNSHTVMVGVNWHF